MTCSHTGNPILVNDNWKIIIPEDGCIPDENGDVPSYIFFSEEYKQDSETAVWVAESIREIAAAVKAYSGA